MLCEGTRGKSLLRWLFIYIYVCVCACVCVQQNCRRKVRITLLYLYRYRVRNVFIYYWNSVRANRGPATIFYVYIAIRLRDMRIPPITLEILILSPPARSYRLYGAIGPRARHKDVDEIMSLPVGDRRWKTGAHKVRRQQRRKDNIVYSFGQKTCVYAVQLQARITISLLRS